MVPLPMRGSSCDDWDATRADENRLLKDDFAPLPMTPSTPGSSQSKRKNRKEKCVKSPRPLPVSPMSTDLPKQKFTINTPRREQQPTRKQSTPAPPPLSSGRTPPTPRTTKSSSRAKASHKASNKSLSNPSPRTDTKHRQVASAAAEAASIRSRRRPRKKLHWNNSVRVKVIHNLGNYTPQEKIDSWFQADDYSMMEDECELTSIHMDEIEFERKKSIQEEKNSKYHKRALPAGFCERGLESWTMQGEELKEQQVQLVIDTVWQAQIDAWEFLGDHPTPATETKDTNDNSENAIHNECWEFIRERASAVSRASQLRAWEIAIQDEQAVDSYLNSLRSLEHSRKRITRMLGRKNGSGRSIIGPSRTITTAKSCRTLATVSSTDCDSRSFCGVNNLKSILKTPKPKRTYSDTRPMRRPQSQSQIPLKSKSDHSKDTTRSSFRIRLPRIGNDSSSSLRSNSLRSGSLRSNSLCGNSLRSNVSRGSSLRSNLSRSNSLNSKSVRSNRSNLSRSNSLNSNSVRSNISRRSNSLCSNVSGNSLAGNSSKKIRYKPKSKTKIPTSPVGSVCNSLLSSQNFSHSNHNSISDEEDLSTRMMRSHMSLSIGSEGSSRRRMLRAYPPL